MRGGGIGIPPAQRIEDGLGQAFAGLPYLERDYLVGGGVVVDQGREIVSIDQARVLNGA